MNKLSKIVLLTFLCGFLCLAGSQVVSATISAKSGTGVKFVEKPTEESTDESSEESSSSSSATDSSTKPSGGSNGNGSGTTGGSTTKPNPLPQTGEIAGGGLLALIGVGIIYFLVSRQCRKNSKH